MLIIGLTMLLFAGQGDSSRFLESIEECREQYIAQAGQDIPFWVDTIEIYYFKMTSSVGFLHGISGAIGERDEDYRLYLTCSVINETNEVIRLGYPMETPYINKDVPEQSEYRRDYLGNDDNYFDVFLFSYGAEGTLAYLGTERYSNTQLYEHLISISGHESETESLPEQQLFGQWLNPESWDSLREQKCWLSLGFSPDGHYEVMNDCYGEEPYYVTERGNWSIEENKIRLYDRNFYFEYAFLSGGDELEMTFNIVGEDLLLYIRSEGPKEILTQVVNSIDGPFSPK